MQFILKPLAGAATAVAMLAAPVAASARPVAANPAAKLSVAPARAGSPTARDSRIAEGPTATLVNIGILAALVVGVLLLTTDDDDDTPDSP